MSLLNFNDYRASHNESSPATRNKLAAAFGLQPMYSADVFGHATPIPAIAEKLIKVLHKNNKKKQPDRSFDDFIDKAHKAADEIDAELDDSKEKSPKKKKNTEKEVDIKKKEDTKKESETTKKDKPTKKEKKEDTSSKDTKKTKKKPEEKKKDKKDSEDFTKEECNEWEQIYSHSLNN